MTEQTTPTVQEKVEVQEDGQRIAKALNEAEAWLVQKVINTIGVERSDEILQKSLTIEDDGGMMTDDNKRRRTPGGVFFKLVKENSTQEERRAIFPRPAKRKKSKKKKPPKPISLLTWDEAKSILGQIFKTQPGDASVKLTLVGRPLQVSQAKSCMVLTMQGKTPPSLPKGLPKAPDGSSFKFAVFVATKQWAKVKDSLAEHPNDKLVIQGYPIFDPKNGVTVLLAQQVQSIEMEKAKKGGGKS